MGPQIKLLTSSIYKHIKIVVTYLRDKGNMVLFSKLSNFYFDLRFPLPPPQGRPTGKTGAKTVRRGN